MSKKKLYIASRSASADAVKRLWTELSDEYEPAFDWTPVKIAQPETDDANRAHAMACTKAATTADALVLIDQKTFHGAFGAIFEFGAAASAGVPCVVVAPLTRETIFFTLPNVRIVNSVDEVPAALQSLAS